MSVRFWLNSEHCCSVCDIRQSFLASSGRRAPKFGVPYDFWVSGMGTLLENRLASTKSL